ncbi:MAG TPA: MIP/aquaporin family protein [Xanthobacteraceae bacterium]|nr:MIP/aquaporin family protein [Xanthobacteraceae bacterium]
MNPRALTAEFSGSALLATTVIGSGIAAQNLSGGNVAIALLANAIATGCILFVIISLFARLSGAHFNPAVSIAFAGQGELPWRNCLLFIVSQTAGMIFGVALAHAMFDLPVLQVSTTNRVAFGTALGEAVATFGLVLTIFGLKDRDATRIPAAVGLYNTGAHLLTASPSFPNPAVPIAPAVSDTFAGIAPSSTLVFVACQIVGAFLAATLAAWWFKPPS